MRVAELMTRDPLVLDVDGSLHLAEMFMRFAHIRHLPVVDAGRVVGLVTHRDLLRASVEGPAQSRVAVSSIMRRDVMTIDADANLREAVRIMIDQKLGCLPVTDGGRLVGIITEADFLKFTDQVLRERHGASS